MQKPFSTVQGVALALFILSMLTFCTWMVAAQRSSPIRPASITEAFEPSADRVTLEPEGTDSIEGPPATLDVNEETADLPAAQQAQAHALETQVTARKAAEAEFNSLAMLQSLLRNNQQDIRVAQTRLERERDALHRLRMRYNDSHPLMKREQSFIESAHETLNHLLATQAALQTRMNEAAETNWQNSLQQATKSWGRLPASAAIRVTFADSGSAVEDTFTLQDTQTESVQSGRELALRLVVEYRDKEGQVLIESAKQVAQTSETGGAIHNSHQWRIAATLLTRKFAPADATSATIHYELHLIRTGVINGHNQRLSELTLLSDSHGVEWK